MKKYKGIIFDMDGLLFDTEMTYYHANQVVADRLGISYDFEVYRQYIGISDEEMIAAYHKNYDQQYGKEVVDRLVNESHEQIFADFSQGKVALKPGVEALMARLNELHIPKVIASSNTLKFIHILLAHSSIKDEFDSIVYAEDVHFAKPNPEIFLKALAKLGLKKEEVLIFEDSKNGILAANQAGIDVVMIPDLILPTEDLKAKTVGVYQSLNDVVEKF